MEVRDMEKSLLEAYRELLAACEQISANASGNEWIEFEEAIDAARETLVECEGETC